jgi:protein SCO1
VRAGLALGAVLLLVAAGCGGSGAKQATSTASSFAGTELSSSGPSPDFALHDQDGKLVRLSGLRGKAVLVTFLYTHCPDVCPLIATNLDVVLRRLGTGGRARARVLAVSVDPKGDDPASVRRFVRSHALLPQFRYLTGTHAQLARVWRGYHIAVLDTPEKTVDHSAYTLLLDRTGRQRVLYDAQVTPAQVLHDLRLLG